MKCVLCLPRVMRGGVEVESAPNSYLIIKLALASHSWPEDAPVFEVTLEVIQERLSSRPLGKAHYPER